MTLSFEIIEGKQHKNDEVIAELKHSMRAESERKRNRLSLGGRLSAKAKHEISTKLKDWAIERYKLHKQTTTKLMKEVDFARKIVHEVPNGWANRFETPERVIYQALLKQRNVTSR